MCDAKRKLLLAPPMQICTLGDRDEVSAHLPNTQCTILDLRSATKTLTLTLTHEG